jgi:hypothetical protein
VNTASEVLVGLGGGTVIIGAFAHWLGKFWASCLIQDAKAQLDLDLESYKVGLRKSEFWFEREFQAATELNAIYRGIFPRYAYPDMEYSEACNRIAGKFEEIEEQLASFLKIHGPVIPDDVTDSVLTGIDLVQEGKFQMHDGKFTNLGTEAAGKLVDKLEEAYKSFNSTLKGQVKN